MTIAKQIALTALTLLLASAEAEPCAQAEERPGVTATGPQTQAADAPAQAEAPAAASPPAVLPSAPNCGQPCTKENAEAATRYVAALVRVGQYADAKSYLEACQQICPRYSCQLTGLYDKLDSLHIEKYASSREKRKYAGQCKNVSLIEVGIDPENPQITAPQQDFLRAVNRIWRRENRPIWAGYGLLGGGAALAITSAVLLGLAGTNRLPVAGDCGQLSGVRGDPCVYNLANPGPQAALSTPLVLGIGGIIAGTALLLTF